MEETLLYIHFNPPFQKERYKRFHCKSLPNEKFETTYVPQKLVCPSLAIVHITPIQLIWTLEVPFITVQHRSQIFNWPFMSAWCTVQYRSLFRSQPFTIPFTIVHERPNYRSWTVNSTVHERFTNRSWTVFKPFMNVRNRLLPSKIK